MDIIIIIIALALNYLINMLMGYKMEFGGINLNFSEFKVEEIDYDVIPCLEWDGTEYSNTVYYRYLVSTGAFGYGSVFSDISFFRGGGREANPRMWVYNSYTYTPVLKVDVLKVEMEVDCNSHSYIDCTHKVKIDYRGNSYGEMKANPRWNPKRLIREEIARVKSMYRTHRDGKKTDNRCKKNYKLAYRNW